MYSFIVRNFMNKVTYNIVERYYLSNVPIITKEMRIKNILDGKPLGRWSLEYGDSASKRSNRANVDHCGTCQTYKY